VKALPIPVKLFALSRQVLKWIWLMTGLVAVETRVTPRPPHRSRRASFSHRALIEGQTQSAFGA
jgi:hypothetical protein